MSKHAVRLTLVELFAIKHALKIQLKAKNKRLQEITETTCWDNELEKEFILLNKDVEHERALVARFEREIKEYMESKRI